MAVVPFPGLRFEQAGRSGLINDQLWTRGLPGWFPGDRGDTLGRGGTWYRPGGRYVPGSRSPSPDQSSAASGRPSRWSCTRYERTAAARSSPRANRPLPPSRRPHEPPCTRFDEACACRRRTDTRRVRHTVTAPLGKRLCPDRTELICGGAAFLTRDRAPRHPGNIEPRELFGNSPGLHCRFRGLAVAGVLGHDRVVRTTAVPAGVEAGLIQVVEVLRPPGTRRWGGAEPDALCGRGPAGGLTSAAGRRINLFACHACATNGILPGSGSTT
ncbi:hypothetical protein ACVWZD_001017 [Streptomyces sp. TE3672]